jgi:hypothetical protein
MALRDAGEQIVIDGTCSSACTLVLGIVPHDRICVTSNAVFDLGGPIVGKAPFDTGAGGPAGLGMGGVNAIESCFHIGECAAPVP